MKKKQLIVLAILAAVFLIVTMPISVFVFLKNVETDKRIDGYLEPYKELAICCIKNDEDIKSRFDGDFDIEYNSVSYRYTTDEYVNFVFYRKYPESAEEFKANVEYMDFSFEIGSDDYIVALKKDDSGEFFVSECYLDN